ncbi:RNA polymerase II transcriptional coactivator-like [Tubulanus polymorphus]|uniref:RNA polymerase II transcriptional coactivator-like n=1 Tax=Tubulanus polymorphus TaxID=672921 RepID=UPI003DA4E392
MPKTKEFISSSEDSDSEVEQPKKKKSKSEDKKAKKKASSPPPADEDDGTMKGESGETMYKLSKMRFVSVSEFRGKPLVNIREYYDKDGDLKPGRKGISLSIDQWNMLKQNMDAIDKDVKKL